MGFAVCLSEWDRDPDHSCHWPSHWPSHLTCPDSTHTSPGVQSSIPIQPGNTDRLQLSGNFYERPPNGSRSEMRSEARRFFRGNSRLPADPGSEWARMRAFCQSSLRIFRRSPISMSTAQFTQSLDAEWTTHYAP